MKTHLCIACAALLLSAGCATPGAGAQATQPSVVRKVPLQYVCRGCGAKIEKGSAQGGNFIAKCPRCGKQFLAM